MQAVVLSESLNLAKEWIRLPDMTAGGLLDLVQNHIKGAKDAVIDYVELLQFPSLEPIDWTERMDRLNMPVILAMAVKFGATRLIDNHLFQSMGGESHV